MKSFPLPAVYKLIEPGPVVLLTTASRGKKNIMTMSWHMMVEFEPPLVACVVSEANHSFEALAKTGECVIAIPTRKLARKVVMIGNSSGSEIDKFDAFKLRPLPAKTVKAPLVAECYANLECKVVDTTLMKKLNLFILEVKKAWIDEKEKSPKTIHHHGGGKFVVDGRVIKIKSAKA